MGKTTALDAINLRMPDRPAHTEYALEHRALTERVCGLPADHPDAPRRFYENWQVDFRWMTHDGPIAWKERGRVTDMGHAVYLADGSDRRTTMTCPFKDVDEVMAFDAVQEYGLPEFDALVSFYEDRIQRLKASTPDVLCPGGYYRTIVSGAIDAFGWDMLLEAAARPREFDRVLEGFFQRTLYHVKAWAKTSISVFIQHDDMVWSQGPFMHPDFYRHSIFPRYAKLWAVLKEAGKKVLFCSDGLFLMFMDDILAAGADGLIFEPMNPFDEVCRRFGRRAVIVGSAVDCRTLTFGAREQIRAETDASLRHGLPCPGWIAAVGNHIPPNVPVENAAFYYDYLSSHWKR